MNHKNTKMIAFGLGLMALTACGGGGSKSSSSSSTSSSTAASTNPYATACADLQGCVTIANGFQFPDGGGGTVSCVSGKCTDANSNLTNAQGAYNSGYSAGSSDGYNSGYSDGQSAGYNSGYTDGSNSSSNSSYNSGYNDGYADGSSDGYNSGYNDGYNSGYNDGYSDGSSGSSVIGASKDTDMQRGQAQQMSLADRANAISQQMGMSVSSATQMVQLTDQIKQMAKAGQMTSADRLAIANSALKIAGVTTDEVNTAIASAMKGDMTSANDLMDKAAKNMGMSSGADVRDKLLPTIDLVMP